MKRQLFELLGKDDRRFSPYCWRTRFALAHKALEADYIPCTFGDKSKFAFSGQDKVPVLKDGETSVHDSWSIACYLEDKYPDRPSLFGGAVGRGEARFFNAYVDRELQGALAPLIILDIFNSTDPADRAYFRETREKRFGAKLEDVQAQREQRRPALQKALAPLAAVLAEQPFFCGDSPAYADYIVLGSFQLARGVSPLKLLEPNDPLHAWRARMMELFGGLANSTNSYPV